MSTNVRPGTAADGPRQPSRLHRAAPRILAVDLVMWAIGTAFVLTWWQRPVSGPSDGVAHVVLFGSLTLTALAVVTSRRNMRTTVPLVVASVIVLSVASEGIQSVFASGRSGSLDDVGSDLVGIALGTLVFLTVRSLAREQAITPLAAISTAALLLSTAVGVWYSISDTDWWRCRGAVLSPLEADRVDASPGPVLIFDGSNKTWRSSEGVQDGVHLSETVSRATLCTAVRAEEVTVAASFTVPEPPKVPIVIFGSRQVASGLRSNFEIVVEGRSLIVQFRASRVARAAPRSTLPTQISPGQRVSVVMRYGSEVLTVTVNGELMIYATFTPDISEWALSEPLYVAEEDPARTIGPQVQFAAFFDRAVTDLEMLGMFADG